MGTKPHGALAHTAAEPTDYNTQNVSVAGRRFVADLSGVLFWPSEHILVVSDLHLEKGSAKAHRGRFLPPYDTRETLIRLAEAMDRFEPRTIISLGDSFHDRDGPDRMSDADLRVLQLMQEDRDWIWVTGNHDPEISDRVGGEVTAEMTINGLTFRHEPRSAPVTHEIAGHLHPAAKLSVYGTTIRRPCFVGNGQRLVMPAFGAFTGGLNVLDDAFEPLFGNDGFSVWMRGAEGLYPVPTRQLRGD